MNFDEKFLNWDKFISVTVIILPKYWYYKKKSGASAEPLFKLHSCNKHDVIYLLDFISLIWDKCRTLIQQYVHTPPGLGAYKTQLIKNRSIFIC